MKVNICGVPHEIIECESNFDTDLHMGQINYGDATIKINKNLAKPIYDVSLIHEWLHGALVMLGYNDQTQDEQFVQAMAAAIYGSFDIRLEESE
jgi:hypothetical protein